MKTHRFITLLGAVAACSFGAHVSYACGPGSSGSPTASVIPGDPYGQQSALEECDEVITHGQAGVAAVAAYFMELAPFDPSYEAIWEGALDWIVATAEPQTVGVAWPWAYCDGESQELSYIITIWNAEVLSRGYLLNGNADYLPLIDQALAWVDSEKHELIPETCIWIEEVENHEFSFTALFGVASFLKYNLQIYRATGRQLAADLAHCSAQALVDGKTVDPLGVYWGGTPHTGFCGGGSGIIEALVEADQLFGDTHPQYGATAKSALDYLIATSDDSEAGLKWGVIATDPSIADAKIGRGVSAVGRAFLAAYDAYGDATYFNHALGAAEWVLSQAESPVSTQLKWADGNPDNGTTFRTGWCRGTTGVAHFLYDVTQAGGPKIYGRAAAKAANFLAAAQVSTPSGPVMVSYEGADHVTTDFIWGMAGMVNPIWQPLGGFASRPPLSDVVQNAADWYIANKIDDNGQFRWPYTAVVGPGQIDQRPASPKTPDVFDARLLSSSHSDGYEIGLQWQTEAPAAGSLQYDVFDVRGRRVAGGDIGNAQLQADAGTLSFRWDGKDANGRKLARGSYVLLVRSAQSEHRMKVAVLH